MLFFLSRCTCLPCYRCLRVINFAKIRKPYFAVLGQQSNLNVFNLTISSDCFEVVQTNRMQETVTVNLCSHSVQFSPPSFCHETLGERLSLFPGFVWQREESELDYVHTVYRTAFSADTKAIRYSV